MKPLLKPRKADLLSYLIENGTVPSNITVPHTSIGNSWGYNTTQTLASGQTLTGIGELTAHRDVMVSATVVGGSATLYIEFSVDGGTNYDASIPFSMSDGVNEFHTIVKGSRTCRIRLVAGADNLTAVRIHTEFGDFTSFVTGFDRFSSPRVYRPISTDAAGRMITEDGLRMQVDHGFMYHCSSLNAALANDDTFDMVLTTPSDDYVHMIIEAAGQGFCELSFYEGTAFTGGTTTPVYNMKRTSSRTWGGGMVMDPTVTDAGTLLVNQVMPGGSKNQASGGDSSFGLKWICDASESYMVRLTNRSGGAIRASIGCNHYSSALIDDA